MLGKKWEILCKGLLQTDLLTKSGDWLLALEIDMETKHPI